MELEPLDDGLLDGDGDDEELLLGELLGEFEGDVDGLVDALELGLLEIDALMELEPLDDGLLDGDGDDEELLLGELLGEFEGDGELLTLEDGELLALSDGLLEGELLGEVDELGGAEAGAISTIADIG
jgi:hypothetical protein